MSELPVKKARQEENDFLMGMPSGGAFVLGEQVRLFNLPAFPGLEGQLATVVGSDEDFKRFHVKLHSTDVIKRVSTPCSYVSFQFRSVRRI